MLVREVMTAPVVTVRPDMTVSAAAGVLLEHEITAAPVVEADRLVGIVSELDLVKREVEADPRAHLRRILLDEPPPPRVVADVMTRDVLALPATADVGDVVALMVDERVTSIPIVDGSRVVGIVSRRDVLRMLVRDDDAVRLEVERRIAEVAGERARLVRVGEGIVTLTDTGDADSDLVAVLAARTVPGVIRVDLARRASPAPAVEH